MKQVGIAITARAKRRKRCARRDDVRPAGWQGRSVGSVGHGGEGRRVFLMFQRIIFEKFEQVERTAARKSVLAGDSDDSASDAT